MKILKKMMMVTLFASLVSLGGCFQVSNTDDGDFRTVPVTNNPHVSGESKHMGMPY